ncbi:HpcH/HpaI aldolase/citrate lyase family protein [uncultured Roseibium sp.]|uniref:HpcH/HpaI aldolase family protein n=1 Tax=uncultured Roseibium sp. TaxID=1936171 RepID=UPI00261F1134|nr:HpcH/HpaI aldolase/citrate lyase family protein [uncultured Roseibium sp.]
MKNPKNLFKAALRARKHQLGIWNTIGGNAVPELLGGAGFDWVLIDCEHSPVETLDVLPALQAIAGDPTTSAVVRPAANDPVLFKRLLDFGAQTLMVPYVQTAEEAAAAVSAMRYAPRGIRGMAGMTRATRYGKVDDYYTIAEEELCLIVQLETQTALDNLEAIAETDGVDAVFIGPADLSASMGIPGQMNHPDVQSAIKNAFERLKAMSVPYGILTLDPDAAGNYMSQGTAFTAVGVDLALLADAVAALKERF